ncbi:MAG: hypothetical protein JRE16_11930 [Deltaproteobacteria bacterium]|jgi:hypothetical protein|nr:hypothetical protein [Deltaproteobacteria bacterium]MBW2477318.1 hypothetical protein [Deltaproteobacteria bacterium]MBW2505258.1 hypothetical protein [Deltaproteobacteria bacterium]MBW2521025.1 hypothetical protein [Deltaproteobacteria bacterium]
MTDQSKPMTEMSVKQLLLDAGAKVMSRGGRTENYGAPREFSFEVKGLFPNGLMLHIVARQYDYRDPWEAVGRVNEMVDVTLIREGKFSELPKGYSWFQGRDEETRVDEDGLCEIVACIKNLNPKLFRLQNLTGDM